MSTEPRDITDLADIQKVESPPHDIRLLTATIRSCSVSRMAVPSWWSIQTYPNAGIWPNAVTWMIITPRLETRSITSASLPSFWNAAAVSAAHSRKAI